MNNHAGVADEVPEDQFIVDRILNKRFVGKRVQYLIRWQGYGEEENSWVLKADICPGEVAKYEKGLKAKAEKAAKKKRPSTGTVMKRQRLKRAPSRPHVVDSGLGRGEEAAAVKPAGGVPKKRLNGWTKVFHGPNSNKEAVFPLITGFALGFEPDKIIGMGCHEVTGMAMVLIKWKNRPQAELVPYEEAKNKCPQVLIAYFERMTFWVLPSFLA